MKFDNNVRAPKSAPLSSVKAAITKPELASKKIFEPTLPLSKIYNQHLPLHKAYHIYLQLQRLYQYPRGYPRYCRAKLLGETLNWREWLGQILSTAHESWQQTVVRLAIWRFTSPAKQMQRLMAEDTPVRCIWWLGRLWNMFFDERSWLWMHNWNKNSFIKPHDSLEIKQYSQIVSGWTSEFNMATRATDIASESVTNSVKRNLPQELKVNCMMYILRCDSQHKNMKVVGA